MAILLITPQNYTSFITSQGISFDARQVLPEQCINVLQNRTKLHRYEITNFAKTLRAYADGMDPAKPKSAPRIQPQALGIYSAEEITAEMQRLRALADYLDANISQSLPDPVGLS